MLTLSAIRTAGFAAVATITTVGGVVSERRGVDSHGSTVSEDGATARAAAVTAHDERPDK